MANDGPTNYRPAPGPSRGPGAGPPHASGSPKPQPPPQGYRPPNPQPPPQSPGDSRRRTSPPDQQPSGDYRRPDPQAPGGYRPPNYRPEPQPPGAYRPPNYRPEPQPPGGYRPSGYPQAPGALRGGPPSYQPPFGDRRGSLPPRPRGGPRWGMLIAVGLIGLLLSGGGGALAYFMPALTAAVSSTGQSAGGPVRSGGTGNVPAPALPAAPFTVLFMGSDNDSK